MMVVSDKTIPASSSSVIVCDNMAGADDEVIELLSDVEMVELEEGEVQEISDVSSEEEMLLKQRIRLLENYNSLLEEQYQRKHQYSHHTESKLSNKKGKKLTHTKGRHLKKRRRRPSVRPQDRRRNKHKRKRSSSESDVEVHNRMKILREAIDIGDKKVSHTSLKNRLFPSMVDSNKSSIVCNDKSIDLPQGPDESAGCEVNDKGEEIEKEMVNQDVENDEVLVEEISLGPEKTIDDTNVVIDDENVITNDNKILDSVENSCIDTPIAQPIVDDFPSEDDAEVLRQLALNSKYSRKPNLSDANKSKDETCAEKQDNIKEAIDSDSDTTQLRIIALKSAMLKKALERKRRIKDIRKRRSSKRFRSISEAFTDLDDKFSHKSNNTDIEEIDMEVDPDSLQNNSNTIFFDQTLDLPQNMVYADQNYPPEDGAAHQYMYNDLQYYDSNNYILQRVKQSDTFNMCNYQENDVENDPEEDEDLLRAKLLNSISSSHSKNVAENLKAPSTSQVPVSKTDDSNLIIRLGESESESDCEATKQLIQTNQQILKETFEQRLDMCLKAARLKVESKAATAVTPQRPAVVDKPVVKKHTPVAVKHLPAGDQQEYRKLVKRMSELKNLKMAKKQQAMIDSIATKSNNDDKTVLAVSAAKENSKDGSLPKAVSQTKDGGNVDSSTTTTSVVSTTKDNGKISSQPKTMLIVSVKDSDTVGGPLRTVNLNSKIQTNSRNQSSMTNVSLQNKEMMEKQRKLTKTLETHLELIRRKMLNSTKLKRRLDTESRNLKLKFENLKVQAREVETAMSNTRSKIFENQKIAVSTVKSLTMLEKHEEILRNKIKNIKTSLNPTIKVYSQSDINNYSTKITMTNKVINRKPTQSKSNCFDNVLTKRDISFIKPAPKLIVNVTTTDRKVCLSNAYVSTLKSTVLDDIISSKIKQVVAQANNAKSKRQTMEANRNVAQLKTRVLDILNGAINTDNENVTDMKNADIQINENTHDNVKLIQENENVIDLETRILEMLNDNKKVKTNNENLVILKSEVDDSVKTIDGTKLPFQSVTELETRVLDILNSNEKTDKDDSRNVEKVQSEVVEKIDKTNSSNDNETRIEDGSSEKDKYSGNDSLCNKEEIDHSDNVLKEKDPSLVNIEEIASNVVNNCEENVKTIDDLLLNKDSHSKTAILSDDLVINHNITINLSSSIDHDQKSSVNVNETLKKSVVCEELKPSADEQSEKDLCKETVPVINHSISCKKLLEVEASSTEYESPLNSLKAKHTWSEDVQGIFCPFEVGGSCKDPECKYVHPRPS